MHSNKPKVIIVGYARHGKDTVADLLRENHGYSSVSSSMFAAERVMMPAFERLHGHQPYQSVQECFDDRVNHRAFWYDEIQAYNNGDWTRLAREIFEVHDVYVGMRSISELNACKEAGLADLIVWVDASGRGLPPEDVSSNSITRADADVALDNSCSVEELPKRVEYLVEMIDCAKRGRDNPQPHHFSGWPGAWCMDCGMPDPMEQALGDDAFEIDYETSALIWKDPVREAEVKKAIMCRFPGLQAFNPYKKMETENDQPNPA